MSTTYSPADVEAAATSLLHAGVAPGSIRGALPGSLALASAGALGVAEAAKYVAEAVTRLGLTGADERTEEI